jgi:hypothetical protein
MSDLASLLEKVNVDELAQIIRRVDGNHSLGAGELAEAILAALSPPIKAGEAVPVAWILNHPHHGERLSQAPITDGDRSLGWVDTPLYASPQPEAYGVRAAVIEECAKVAERYGGDANMLQNDNLEPAENTIRRDAAYEIERRIRALSQETPNGN